MLWFQYEVSTALSMLSWWEKVLVHALLFVLLSLVGYGSYKQAVTLHAFCVTEAPFDERCHEEIGMYTTDTLHCAEHATAPCSAS